MWEEQQSMCPPCCCGQKWAHYSERCLALKSMIHNNIRNATGCYSRLQSRSPDDNMKFRGLHELLIRYGSKWLEGSNTWAPERTRAETKCVEILHKIKQSHWGQALRSQLHTRLYKSMTWCRKSNRLWVNPASVINNTHDMFIASRSKLEVQMRTRLLLGETEPAAQAVKQKTTKNCIALTCTHSPTRHSSVQRAGISWTE